MHLMRQMIDLAELPSAISAEVGAVSIWRPAKSVVFAGMRIGRITTYGCRRVRRRMRGRPRADIRAADATRS